MIWSGLVCYGIVTVVMDRSPTATDLPPEGFVYIVAETSMVMVGLQDYLTLFLLLRVILDTPALLCRAPTSVVLTSSPTSPRPSTCLTNSWPLMTSQVGQSDNALLLFSAM